MLRSVILIFNHTTLNKSTVRSTVKIRENTGLINVKRGETLLEIKRTYKNLT